MRLFAARLEQPMAYMAFTCALVTLVLKCPIVGIIESIPIVGKSMTDIFNKVHVPNPSNDDDDDASDDESSLLLPQYPRRLDDENFWNTMYFVMYGLFGTIAQYSSLQITLMKNKKKTTKKTTLSQKSLVLYSRWYGMFHITIAIHHLMWSCNVEYGKLQLYKFHLPGTYVGPFLASFVLLYLGYQIGFGTNMNTSSSSFNQIRYYKSIMDTTTCTTFISFIIFFICNVLGIETNYNIDRILWGITMYLAPMVVIFGHIFQPKKFGNDDDDDESSKAKIK